MRILLANDLGAPVGGAEIMALTLRDSLRSRGHEVRLLSSDARPGGLRSEADYHCRGGASGIETLALRTANPWAAAAMRRVVREFRPDVVHVLMFLTRLSPLVLRAARGVPTAFTAVWYRAVCPTGTKRLPTGASCSTSAGAACVHAGCIPARDLVPHLAQQTMMRRWIREVRAVVAVSRRVRERFEEAGLSVHDVIPAPIPARPARPPLAGAPTVVFGGRLVAEKGTDVLLRAFARVRETLPAARLVVAGDGPERDALVALASELGLGHAFEMLPHLRRDEVERRFDAGWVQAVPSVWDEPFGMVAAEAMARGTAVVASASGGLADIVRHGDTGLLVPPGDVDALARALGELLADRERCERLGRRGREVMTLEYDADAVAARYELLYERCIHPERGPTLRRLDPATHHTTDAVHESPGALHVHA